MRTLLQLLAVLGTLSVASVAHAEPTAFYDRNSGRVFLQNDTIGPLFFILFSDSGRITGMPGDIPGVTSDVADLPIVLTYFDVPPTGEAEPPNLGPLHNIGIIIPGGGPLGDLELETLRLIGPGGSVERMIIEIPEPSGFAIACVTTLSLLATARAQC